MNKVSALTVKELKNEKKTIRSHKPSSDRFHETIVVKIMTP